MIRVRVTRWSSGQVVIAVRTSKWLWYWTPAGNKVCRIRLTSSEWTTHVRVGIWTI